MDKPILRLVDVSKFYHSNNNVAVGIRKVNVSFNLGEFVIITGASGSGKSTLLSVLGGMTTYEEGEMYINGEDTSYFGFQDYEEYRRSYVSFIFQNYNLIESYSVYENIEMALVARGMKKEERKQIVLDVIEKVGLTKRMKNRVVKLSGGEKQRVAIARALISDAPILICDEITGNLDRNTGIEIIELLRKLSKEKLVLMVTHDPEEVEKYATRKITMHDGAIDEDKKLIKENNVDEIRLKQNNPISKKDIYRTAFKSIKNTPRRTILMSVILLLAVIFIGFACASTSIVSEDIGGGDYYRYEMAQYLEERILVKRKDGAILTSVDYDYLNSLDHIKKIYNDESAIDYPVVGNFFDDDDYWLYERGFFMNSSMLKESDLTYGRLPSNKNEVVVLTSKYNEIKDVYESNKEIIIYDDQKDNKTSLFNKSYKVVGYIIDEKTSSAKFYITDDALDEYGLLARCKNIRVEMEIQRGYFYDFYVFEDNSLEDDNVLFYYMQDTYDIPEGEEITNVKIYNVSQECSFENVKLTTKKYSEGYALANLIKDKTGLTDGIVNSEATGFWYAIIFLPTSKYNEVFINNKKQTSILVDDAKYVSDLVSTLCSGDYVALQFYEKETDASADIIGIILGVFVYGYCILFTLIIYLISSLSLKNIVFSQRKDYLSMRSLGINTKDINKMIYIQIYGIGIFVTIFFSIALIIMKQFYFPSYSIFYTLYNMKIFELIFTYLLIAVLLFLLTRKFTKNIFNSNIAYKGDK